MKRLNPQNNNEPELFSQDKYIGNLACYDMEREYQMAKYFNGTSYVSIGCLNSAMPPLLAENIHNDVYGIDFADKVISFLQPRFPKVKYIRHDIREGLPFEDNSIDYIVAGEVIEHLEDPKKLFEECMRVLVSGGWLSISTPWEENTKQAAVDKHAHVWSFSEQDMKDFGFTEVELLKEGIQTSIIAWRQKLAQ